MSSPASLGPGGLGWKTFRFFDEIHCSAASLPANVSATATTASDTIWLGTADGLIVCLNDDFTPAVTLPAFRGRVHCLVINAGRLAALGEEEEGIKTMTLKAWDLAGLQSGVTPPPLAAAKIFAASKLPEGEVQATAVCLKEWPIVAVGLGTSRGALHVLRGNAIKSKITPPYGRYLLRSAAQAGEGVTDVHFAGFQAGGEPHIFAVAANAMAAISLTSGEQLMSDDCGARPKCSAVTRDDELVLAGPEAISFYTAEEGRKAAVAARGEKLGAAVYRHYVAVSMPGEGMQRNGVEESQTVFQVFDVSHKVIAASAVLRGAVQWVVRVKQGLVVAEVSGTVVRFLERPLEARLEALFRVRAFQLALKVAQAENAPLKTLAHVHRHFGDFLYSKRDYDGAAMEYIATIGWLEPSHAIQRFLQPQRATNLTAYLKVLHERGLATADHTTILLTCYAKLKQVDAIEDFLQRARAVGGGDSAFHLDAHAAVAALRNAGLGNMTLAAAEVSEDPQLRLEVLVRDCRRASDGLAFLKTLGRQRAAEALKRYGKELLDAEPVGTTATLMELCLPISPSHSASASDEDSKFVANFAEFTHLYADRPDDLRYACMTILAMGESAMDSSSRQALYHTLLDLYLTCNGQSVPHSKEEKQALEEGTGAPGRTSPPNDDSGRAAALDLLQRGWAPGSEPAYDVARALTACRLHSFAAGLVFLYTNLRMYRDAAAVLADNSDWEGLLELCERYGNAPSGGDPEVWRDALERLSSPAAGPSSAGPLRKLLARIETAAVLPPLAVLPVLAQNPHLKLDLVKDYVTRALEAENRAIVHDLDEAKRLQAEVEEAENAVKRLTTEPVVFQASRDAQTGAPLELPSVHFLCGHSFNLRTLGDGVESGSAQCPLCAPETRRLEELQRSHRAAAADKDSFFKQLRAAPDGFALITEYFGKGMLNNASSSV